MTDNKQEQQTQQLGLDSLHITSTAPSSSSSSSSSTSSKLPNINIGILGHVDSGKTSLAKALSTHISTAALDKLPQSQQRGITLDLGFSCFHMHTPTGPIQCTLVDCPGHASLIRTIIGGAQIIDMIFLVVDAIKGIQTHTAECIVLAEIVTQHIIVVINKVELVKEARDLEKLERVIRHVFKSTKFGEAVPIVRISANPESSDSLQLSKDKKSEGVSVQKPVVQPLLDALSRLLPLPSRNSLTDEKQTFIFAVDHCFQIKGQGTVLTGTVLSGSISVNQMIEIPSLSLERKIKSMQMFKQPVETIEQGDRAGICVTQLDSSLLERGLVCTPGAIRTFTCVIAQVDKIRFYKQPIETKAKFHVSIGHATSMATAYFFGGPPPLYPSESERKKEDEKKSDTKESTVVYRLPPPTTFDFSLDYPYLTELQPVSSSVAPHTQYAILIFEKPLQIPQHSVVIGSRLDTDIHLNTCRLAFQGRVVTGFDFDDLKEREKLKLYKLKEKVGTIDRLHDNNTLICKDLFQKGSDMSLFLNMRVTLEDGRQGTIDSSFGQGGKFKAYFRDGLGIDDDEKQDRKGKPNKNIKGKIFLRFKKYMFASDKKQLIQS